ncbi:MAG: AGE family epimerase/isomerase [Erysipelotrichales bacterium]|nr:AGE family epimerase/isomerase [Erysipelotrichales bacterium]
MNKKRIIELQRLFSEELFESVIPFWTKHSLDHEFGGYYSCLERDGTVFDTDKFAWMQGREIWMFSKLCSEYGVKPEWLEAAKHGVEFMKEYGINENGDTYFSLDRKGNPLMQPYNIYSDCFLCTAYAEYSRVSGDKWAKEEALRLYQRIQERQTLPKGTWTKQVPGARVFSAMSFPMIQMTMARELKGYLPDEIVEPVIQSTLDAFWSKHVDWEKKRVFERVLPEGGHNFDVMEGRLLNPGHALEILWLIMDVAASRSDKKMIDDCAEVMLWSIESGWDNKYGGIYYYQDYLGYPTEKLESTMKLWWVHAEAIVAMLLAYKLTGRKEFSDWFEKITEYSFKHFSDKNNGGEWFGYLDRQGEPVFTLKGGKWKGFFHLPRTLMLCEQWLSDMIKDKV